MLIYPNVRIFSIKLPTFLVVKWGKKISEIGLLSYWVIFKVYLPLFSYRSRLPSVSCFSFIVLGSWRLENICFSQFWKSGLCKGMWEFSSLNGEFRKSLIHKWVRLLGLSSLDLCKRKTLGTLLTALANVSAEIKSRCSLLVNENYICMTLEVKKRKIFGTQNLLSRSIRDNESSVEILLHWHTKATPNSRINRMKLDAIFKLRWLDQFKVNTLYTFLFSWYAYLSVFVSAFYSQLFVLNQRGHICCSRSIFFQVVVRRV